MPHKPERSGSQRRATVRDALDALRRGRPVLVTDDGDRENEGDVVLAAQSCDAAWIAWTVRHTSGMLCAPMTGARADLLGLPPMVSHNEDPRGTAYTVSVDARHGITTGISAADRARTLRLLADPSTQARDLVRPGHVFPLRARPGGVLERRGHTEAAVDLCRLAGLAPVGVIAEVVTDDGRMARLGDLLELGRRFSLPVISVAELADHRVRESGPDTCAEAEAEADGTGVRVRRAAEATVMTSFGPFRMLGYRDLVTGAEHVALVAGEPRPGALVRVHSECLTGESFGSLGCECGPQLDESMRRVSSGSGVVVYLRGHEGRGIGLLKKIAAYRLQEEGRDTIEANLELGEPADAREYGAAAAILADLGLRSVTLLSNNPEKQRGLERGGVGVSRRVALHVGAGPFNTAYLLTKREAMGHSLPAPAAEA
ncbi:MAG: 3,4-dihydroxy-2-butanone-4-phosphate synthase [Frankia sp.]